MIIINTSFELKQKTGIGAYVLVLIKCLEKLKKDYKAIELCLAPNVKFKYYWQLLWLNSIVFVQTLITKPSIFLSPSFIMPFFKNKGTKYVTVIHDLAVYRKYEVTNYVEKLYRLFINIALNRADLIVTVSDTIKQEIVDKFDYSKDKIKVVYNSIGQHFINAQINNNIIEKYDLESKKYILSVATLNKRKNIPELIKAFEQISNKYPDLKLVLVGGMGNEQREKLTKHPNVIFTGYIKDEELPTLYSNALLYMYPSLYEGFGIPLIEAQYCGCPVLCSDIPVFREIGANSVEYCNPTSNSIANELEVLINNPELLSKLSSLGSENVKRFSIENIAKQLNEVIK